MPKSASPGNASQPADLLLLVSTFLKARGHEFIGRPDPVQGIEVQALGSAFIATLRFPDSVHKLVVKPVGLNHGLRSADRLREVLSCMAASSPRIAAALPSILGTDEAMELLILEYVAGEGLEDQMRRCLQSDGPPNDHAGQIREAAHILAEVHRFLADDLLRGQPVRDFGSFVPGFERGAVAFASVFQKAGFEGPGQILNRLSPAFYSRIGDRVGLIDARPKNLLVRPSGGLTFIDLDCAPMSPARAVATFLVTIDRLGTRHPRAKAQRRLAAWKHTFVSAYCEASVSTLGEDLTFFYPWTLWQMFEQHRRLWPALTPYFHWYYGRPLARFLGRLARLSPADVAASPADLFAPSLETTR